MNKILLLSEGEYLILQKVLTAVPPAYLTCLLPDYDGSDMFHYRLLLRKVLHKDFSFPKTDEGLDI